MYLYECEGPQIDVPFLELRMQCRMPNEEVAREGTCQIAQLVLRLATQSKS